MTTRAALARGLAGALVLVIALAVVSAVATAVDSYAFAARLLPAAVMTAVTIGLLALLLRRDRRPWRFVGVTGTGSFVRGFALGVGVMAASTILVFGGATALGLVGWGALDPAALALFLVTNTVVALLLEAIPEELALRGYVQSSLGARFRRLLTVLLTTVFFLLSPFLLRLAQSVFESLTTGTASWSFTPNGEHPADYYVLLAVFGVTLSLARWATPSASIATSIATHLAYLTVARITISGDADVTGVGLTLVTPDAILVIPLVLVIAALGFGALGRRTTTDQAAPPAAA
jgi:membrane protease YdiL (CAAX protease family)